MALLSLALALFPQAAATSLEIEVRAANGNPVPSVAVRYGSGVRVTHQLEFLWSHNQRPPSVIDRAHTNQLGRCRVRLEPDYVAPGMKMPAAVWIFPKGHGLTTAIVDRGSLPAGEPLRMMRRAETVATITVLDPARQPVLGARVTVLAVTLPKNRTAMLPREYRTRLCATTDARGHAKVRGVRQGELCLVRVDTQRWGSQLVGRLAGRQTIDTVVLRRTGRLKLQFRGETKELDGMRLLVQSKASRRGPQAAPVELRRYQGIAEVVCDRSGTVSIPQLAAGRLIFSVIRPDRRSALPVFRFGEELAADGERELEFELRPTVALRGRVLEHGTKRPVPHALIRVGAAHTLFSWHRTDAQGRYSCRTIADQLMVAVERRPPAFITGTGVLGQRIGVPPGATEFDAAPILLTRGAEVRGRVVDEQNRAVAGAFVSGIWRETIAFAGGSSSREHTRSAYAGADGTFVLEGIKEGVEFSLKARFRQARSLESISAKAGDTVTLRISERDRYVMRGRVVDGAGKPVDRAHVRFFAQVIPKGPRQSARKHALESGGKKFVVTDAEGRFSTPCAVGPGFDYRAVASKAGMVDASTPWCKPEEPFPTLIMRFRHSLSGRVVDEHGRPVVRARVSVGRKRAVRTGEDGAFELHGLAEGKAILVVSKTGAWHAGKIVDIRGKAEPVEIRLLSRTVMPPRRVLPAVLPRERRRELARQVLEPYLEITRRRGKSSDRRVALRALAAVDPKQVLERLDKQGLDRPSSERALRCRVAAALLERGHRDEAEAILSTIDDPYRRGIAWLDLVTASKKRRSKLRSLRKALLLVRRSSATNERAWGLSKIASHYLELDQRELANELFDEAKTSALKLPRTSSYRGWVATELVRVDPTAAVSLIEDLGDQSSHARFHGELAHRLASVDPETAERLANSIQRVRARDAVLVKVCHAMAPVDLARARRVAKEIDDVYHRAHAHAAIADAVAQDKETAAKLLDDAFCILEKHVEDGEAHIIGGTFAAGLAATFSAVAERIDPRFVEPSVWRAVALRADPGPVRMSYSDDSSHFGPKMDSLIAMTLARYDRDLGRALLEPALEHLPIWATDRYRTSAHVAYGALAILDPEAVVRLVQRTPIGPDTAWTRFGNRARISAAMMLAVDGNRRWARVMTRLRLWILGAKD